ncbi:uncharacterized protein [Dendrobates tinctorius]|uniref:uncharacterized protein n=1 Tax=Dendrobates tinctorius TaxID=92724 RepID=UPI003CCA075E
MRGSLLILTNSSVRWKTGSRCGTWQTVYTPTNQPPDSSGMRSVLQLLRTGRNSMRGTGNLCVSITTSVTYIPACEVSNTKPPFFFFFCFTGDRVIIRWRSLRDRFKRDYNKETPSGSGGRRQPQYKNYKALAFLRSTMVCRSTICSTRESASELRPSGVIPSETAPGDHIEVSDPSVPTLLSHPSIPSTSTGAAGQTSSHEAAGDDLFSVPHPSDTAATSRPTFGSGRQRLRSQERMTLSDCLSLNSSVQHGFHTFGERLSSGLTMINQSIMELRRYMERMNLESNQTPTHTFFQSVVRQMEGLSTHQQMRVMQACQNALVEVLAEASHPPPVHPPPVHPPPVHPPSVHPPSVHPPSVHPPSVHPPSVHPPSVHPPSVHPSPVYPSTVHSYPVHPSTTIHHTAVPPPTTPSPFSSSPFHSSQYLPSPLHYTPMPSPYPPPHTPSMYPQTSSVHPLPSQPHVLNPPSTSGPLPPLLDVVDPVNPSNTISTQHYHTL